MIFCTAGLMLDEQEATRFLLLSPEISQEKIQEAIQEKIKKEANTGGYRMGLEKNPQRMLLQRRILAIKEQHISEIRIENPEFIEEKFYTKVKVFKPRHSRDIARIISLTKVFALLNLWYRDRIEGDPVANTADIEEAFVLWEQISESQELNLPPYIYNLYHDVLLRAYEDKNNSEYIGGVTKQEVLKKHFEVYGRHLPEWQLRQQILPMLENTGLITCEASEKDKRKVLIYPTTSLTASQGERA